MLRNRLIVLALLVLSVIAISFYGGPVTYGFFFLMLLIPAVSFGYCYLVYLRYRIYQVIVTKNVVVGSPVEYYFTLQNEDFYSFSGIKVEFFSDFSSIRELDSNNEFEISPGSGIKKSTVLTCKYRGEYDVGVRNVIVQDYLRLFSLNFKNKENLRAIVLPRLEILDSLTHSFSTDVFRDSKVNANEPDVLVREYIPGDDIRSINWKTTAHMGKPYVRTKTGLEQPSVGIVMDSYRANDNPAEFLPLENKILETALAVAYYYLSRGINVTVYTYERTPRQFALQGIASFEEFYSSLAKFSFNMDNEPAKLFEYVHNSGITACSMVYMIVHEFDDRARFEIDELNKNGIPVTFYHISDTDNSDNNTELGKNTEYKRIGYEDRLKEVL